jgi:hypothetical protein
VLDDAAAEIHRWSATLGDPVKVDWRDELTIRTRISGLQPDGPISASGACRVLRAADEWVAITVARAWDHEVLPALVEGTVDDDHWATLARWVADRPGADVVSRARLLDMAAARHGTLAPDTPSPLGLTRHWRSRAAQPLDRLSVVDLSSLWAGPLVARILHSAGATVTKIESVARPDGAREIPDFYRQLHTPDQRTVALDLSTPGGRTELIDLLEGADVVIEASRPRALAQLGTGPGRIRARSGRVWLSITGYGRTGPGAHWIAFGDDAAVAGGLTGRSDEGDPVFCTDAVADPVTGLLGAAAVLRSLAGGGGHLIDLSLAGAAAAVARGAVAPVPDVL